MGTSLIAIFCGAGFGALLRAGFNVLSAGMVSGFPMGTLLANCLAVIVLVLPLPFLAAMQPSGLSGDYLSSRDFLAH